MLSVSKEKRYDQMGLTRLEASPAASKSLLSANFTSPAWCSHARRVMGKRALNVRESNDRPRFHRDTHRKRSYLPW